MSSKKIKNKDFLKWTRAESCQTKDNIVSTEWHERLERNPMFVPTYAKGRPEMTYILSMEYGRMWQKEKDEWFSLIFRENPKERRMLNKRKKLRREIREAKRQAEIKIRERKERLAKEAEAKAKAEAEAQEKAKRIKAKCKAEKWPLKKRPDQMEKKIKPVEKQQETETDKKDECPKGWIPVELTVQCECAANKEKEEADKKDDTEPAEREQETENKPEEVPCKPECIQNQIVEAVEKMAEGDMPN